MRKRRKKGEEQTENRYEKGITYSSDWAQEMEAGHDEMRWKKEQEDFNWLDTENLAVKNMRKKKEKGMKSLQIWFEMTWKTNQVKGKEM